MHGHCSHRCANPLIPDPHMLSLTGTGHKGTTVNRNELTDQNGINIIHESHSMLYTQQVYQYIIFYMIYFIFTL